MSPYRSEQRLDRFCLPNSLSPNQKNRIIKWFTKPIGLTFSHFHRFLSKTQHFNFLSFIHSFILFYIYTQTPLQVFHIFHLKTHTDSFLFIKIPIQRTNRSSSFEFGAAFLLFWRFWWRIKVEGLSLSPASSFQRI